ncbi:LysR family transcriptional regulator [Paraburkholderia fungorum]|uniref:LysR family transcriptional regulator n=1 Tax=Paraburkholderia fungorum TaxID=134537 RepID=UPI0038BAAFCA
MNESNQARRLSIRHLRAFVAVAECRSLTRAAETLSVTQSALSLTIQHLEQHLGLAMFDRSTRRLDLTSAADEFLPTARRLLQDFDASINEMRALGKRERGRVGVAAVPSVLALLLSEASAAFIDKFPGIDLYLREDNSESVQQRILSGDVDFGICSPWGSDAQLTFEPLFEDTYGVVTARDHPLADRTGSVPWSALGSYRIIGFSADLGMQHQLTETSVLSQEVREPRYRVSNTSTIATLLTRGAGVSVMSALAAQRAPLDSLSFRLLKEPTLSRTVGVLTRVGRSLSPAATAMMVELREALPTLARFSGVRLVDDTSTD